MTITWIHLGLVLLGVLAMALYSRGTQSSSSAPAGSAAPVNHPIIDSLVSVLESTIAQNPQLSQLEGALVTLLHPNGNINLSLTKGGSHVASAPSPAPVPAAAGVAKAA